MVASFGGICGVGDAPFFPNSITCSQMLEMFLKTVCLQPLHCFSYFVFFQINDSHIPSFSTVKLLVTLTRPWWQLEQTASIRRAVVLRVLFGNGKAKLLDI
jgi:hypothetical protein